MRINHIYIPLFGLVGLFLLGACKNGKLQFGDEPPLFTLMDSTETGFFFWNEIYEKEELNALNYGYFYNGGGVAVGDINNDGLPDVYMVGNTFGGRLYVNDGNLKFHQITQTSNTYSDGFIHGVTMADVNQDGFLDIYICRTMTMNDSQRANKLFINNGDETFTERAYEYGIADRGFSTHANFFDYDKDGDLDLYVLNHSIEYDRAMGIITKEQRDRKMNTLSDQEYEQTVSKLYRNNGDNTFTDVSRQSGVADIFFGLSATVADVNNDGWPDLYCTSDFADQDHMYINQGDGTFRDVIKQSLGHFSQNSMGSDIADINNDGYPDVLTVDMMAEENFRHKQLKGNNPYDLFHMSNEYGYGYQVMRNCLQLNNGDGSFSEVGQLAGISHTDWSWAPLIADFDNDGHKDIFITNGYYRDITDMDNMNYESDEIIKKAGGKQYVRTMDLLVGLASNPIPNYMYRSKGDGTFENKSAAWGLDKKSFSNGAAYADLDLDGDLDLIVNNFAEPSFLYRNNAVENNSENAFVSFVFLPKQHALVQGTKITLFTNKGKQYQELSNNRGFLSTVQQILHFGLGKNAVVEKVQIEYPNGTIEVMNKPTLNKQITLDITNGKSGQFEKEDITATAIQLIETAFLPELVIHESQHIDFKDEPLLEQMNSNRGPFACAGDVNGDGLDDIYFGGAASYPGHIYLQSANGQFVKKSNIALEQDQAYEDGQSVFFDADKDGDLDLFVCSGSSEVRDMRYYENRLYLNDGQGNFTRSIGMIPSILTNTIAVEAIDVDQDGDMDLFVGGHVIPLHYPSSFASYMLINQNGKFRADSTMLPEQGMLGIINDVEQINLNKDVASDLILVGDWMPITILINQKNTFRNETVTYGFDKSNGMWNCVMVTDVNGDGKKDILAGNRGLNSFFTCSTSQPATMYVDDFDQNGETEAVVNYYFHDGVLYPKYSLNELLEQMPSFRGLFPRYAAYSSATSDKIFNKQQYPNMQSYFCYTFASTAFIRQEDKFKAYPLPYRSQFSPIYAFALFDKENAILSAGNNYAVDVNQGRYDASFGSLQYWDNGKFSIKKIINNKVVLGGEVRMLLPVRLGKQQRETFLIIAANATPELISL